MVSPSTVAKKNTSYVFLTSWFSNTAFKKLTNFGGMPDYFENLNVEKKMLVLRNLCQALLLTQIIILFGNYY